MTFSLDEAAFSPRAYRKRAAMIPMRDGVQLYTEIYEPNNADKTSGIILQRTPYNCKERGFSCSTPQRDVEIARSLEYLARDKHIFVIQDIRGTHGSQGEFCFLNTPAATPGGPNEATDAWDTVEWLLTNVQNTNGRLGLIGFSYAGFTVLAGLLDPHPAIVAASPQSAMADLFRGDDIYINGAFILGAALPFAHLLETGQSPVFDAADAYEFWRQQPLCVDLDERLTGRVNETWRAFFQHDRQDDYWRVRTLSDHFSTSHVPALHVLGWYDFEDFVGPLNVFHGMAACNDAPQRLVIGPWRHGGWVFHARGGRALGPLCFDEDVTEAYLRDVEAPFFRAYLSGEAKEYEAKAPVTQLYEVNGAGWRNNLDWPPKEVDPTLFYLGGDGALTPNEPASPCDRSYHADPASPIPYTERPVGFYSGVGRNHSSNMKQKARALFALESQAFIETRKDQLTWTSDPLTADIALGGAAELDVDITTSTTDADFILHLLEISEGDDGSIMQFPVSRCIIRAAYYKDPSKPKPLVPGQKVRYLFKLQDRFYRFKRGRRIGLRLQSSWFPLLASNPQDIRPSEHAYNAEPVPATITVCSAPGRPASLTLPCLVDKEAECG